MCGGGEYEIVFTVGRGGINSIFSATGDTRMPLTHVGYVEAGEGAYLRRREPHAGARWCMRGIPTGIRGREGSDICDVGLE